MNCPNCNMPIGTGASFCSVCKKRIVICSRCGKPMVEGTKYCASCGASFGAAAAGISKDKNSSSTGKEKELVGFGTQGKGISYGGATFGGEDRGKTAGRRSTGSTTPPTPPQEEKQGNGHAGRTILILVVILLVLLAAAVILIRGFGGKDSKSTESAAVSTEEADYSSVVEVTYSGYNGGGVAAGELDTDAYYDLTGTEAEDYSIVFRPGSGLSNGDKVTVVLTVNEEQSAFRVTVEGLPEPGEEGTEPAANEEPEAEETVEETAEPENVQEEEPTQEETPVQEETEPETVPAAGDGDYIFPQSATDYLTEEDLSGLSAAELRLARNEIYARKGYIFEDPELLAYFESKPWYEGTYTKQEFEALGDSVFNDYERANIILIRSVEAEING